RRIRGWRIIAPSACRFAGTAGDRACVACPRCSASIPRTCSPGSATPSTTYAISKRKAWCNEGEAKLSPSTVQAGLACPATISPATIKPVYRHLLVTRSDDRHVVTVVLNRPEQHNAMNTAMGEDLLACFDALARDADARAVVFTGAGDKAFCAGGD